MKILGAAEWIESGLYEIYLVAEIKKKNKYGKAFTDNKELLSKNRFMR